ncbi:NlpC/P60 family protein [Streptomyces sp. NPDC056227]|uniref:C40 family peptidase n=1 Tax=Streptomyces sp. NPDC056227 TaxID=3345753 RepID=UPI0035E16899
MSSRVLRTVCAAALATVVAASPAVAAPADPSSPGHSGPAREPRATKSVAGLLTELKKLYQQAEEASEAYNGTTAKLKKRQAEAKKLDTALAVARTTLGRSRNDAGRLAREQYQGQSDFSSYVQLMLSRDPEHALDQEHVIQRMAAGRATTVKRLTGAEKRADGLASASRKVLEKQRVLAARQKKQRDTVQSRLRKVEALLAKLSAEQIARVSRLEQQATDKAQGTLVTSGALSSARPPSQEGDEAVKYAVRQLGKPYVWGAEGPGSFDCSGLTSQAWANAGHAIPRTSQEQWRQLRKVPLNTLRPGDLVIYFPKATHVALYVGNGLVVQAPRPGSQVKVSPLASNPLLGAVRPDPKSPSLSSYSLPELARDASSGSDAGYDSSSAPGDE